MNDIAIPEDQLERWSHQGTVDTAKKTYESIRAALKGYNRLNGVEYDVYLQGSYKNATNIRGDSDVDVVVQLNSTFSSNLPEEQERMFSRFTTAGYRWEEFRSDVLSALRNYFGWGKVQEGRKSLKVETPYLHADVVVCIQYRKYNWLPRSEHDFIEGMTFYVPSEGRWVINYPKLHYKNGCEKNEMTNRLYKKAVRIFKNARTYLMHRAADRGEVTLPSVSIDLLHSLGCVLAPSYFLECLLYNVPNNVFSGSFQEIFFKVISWLRSAPLLDFICQNGQVALFGDTPEQWTVERAKEFIRSMADLWNNWS